MNKAGLALLLCAACTTSPAPSATSATSAVRGAPPAAPEQEPLAIDTVLPFPPDVATPGPQVTPILEEVAAKLRAHPSAKVEIAGHCDDTEKEEVAYARANLVASGLAARGVPRTRVTVETYGALRPIAPNTSPENRAKNRRVDFKVLSP